MNQNNSKPENQNITVGPGFEESYSRTIDGWIERLLRCEYLLEDEVKSLCARVCLKPLYPPNTFKSTQNDPF